MIKNSLNWWVRPRVLGMLLAKLLLSVATPLAGQPNEIGGADAAVMVAIRHCGEYRAAQTEDKSHTTGRARTPDLHR